MKRIKLISLFFVLFLLSSCNQSSVEEYKESFFAMDTYMTITAYGENSKPAVLKAKKKIQELESLWSVTDKTSDIYKINHSDNKEITVSSDTFEVINFALDMAEKTNGALDPTIYPVLSAWGFTNEKNRVPPPTEIKTLLKKVGYKKVQLANNKVKLEKDMMLDLGAVGKGYTGDIVLKVLKQNGINNALLDLGGNIQVIGKKPDRSDWKLGIKDPTGNGNVGILSVSENCAVITSGNYERCFTDKNGKQYGHIINPKSGYPADSELLSVTIVSKDGKLCDALSTSLFVMGLDDAKEYWNSNRNFNMILITKSGEIFITEDIKEAFILDNQHNNLKVRVISNEN